MNRWHRSLIALAVVGSSPLVMVACDGGSMDNHRVDPVRWCFAIQGMDAPWSCYLKADRPYGIGPVWVGKQSEVRIAAVNHCEQEDQTNCYWNARIDGINGLGMSFYTDETGHTYYERTRS